MARFTCNLDVKQFFNKKQLAAEYRSIGAFDDSGKFQRTYTAQQIKEQVEQALEAIKEELQETLRNIIIELTLEFAYNWKSLYTRRWSMEKQNLWIHNRPGKRVMKMGLGVTWQPLTAEWIDFKTGGHTAARFYNWYGQLASAIAYSIDAGAKAGSYVATTVTLNPSVMSQVSQDSRYYNADGSRSKRKKYTVRQKFMMNEFGPVALRQTRPAYMPLRDVYHQRATDWIAEKVSLGGTQGATAGAMAVGGTGRRAQLRVKTSFRQWLRVIQKAGVEAKEGWQALDRMIDQASVDNALSPRKSRAAGGKQVRKEPANKSKIRDLELEVEEYRHILETLRKKYELSGSSDLRDEIRDYETSLHEVLAELKRYRGH